ncbi:MAG: class I tRNA ligase family protein [Metamycoplasmataceae bacterium]
MYNIHMKFIYLCGPTVYDKVHMGNMRPIITFDLFIRAMKHLGTNVTLIHNITDIDDKIIEKSKELKVSEKEVSDKYFSFYKEMLKKFNINTIIDMPTVTENIDIIIDSIKKLEKENKVYVSDNSVYFDVKSIKTYGSISNKKFDEFVNIEKNIGKKRNIEDFVVWKSKTEGLTWDSPWGKGRPGWHTECFAFADIFGQAKIDIHGGGIDLKFPHHENENAQFVGLHDREITKEWIHLGIVNLNGQKMSKSEKNILYADDFLSKNNYQYNADIFRLILLNSNYKNTIEFTEQLYNDNYKKLNSLIKIYNLLLIEDNYIFSQLSDIKYVLDNIGLLNFSNAMKDINEMIKLFNEKKTIKIGNYLISIFKILGFQFTEKIISEKDKMIYQMWKEEKSSKNWVKADELRNMLSHILGKNG